MGDTRKVRPERRLDLDVSKLVKAYQKGLSLQAVGEHFGVSFKAVRSRLLEAGIVLRSRTVPRLKRPSVDQLQRWYVEGRLSTRDIEKITGVSTPTIRMWLREASIAIRSIAEAKKGQKPAPHTVHASVTARRKHVLPGRPDVGYQVNADGYVLLWDQGTQSYRKEHRLVLAQKISRPLLPKEDVHHINGDRQDNQPENLDLMPSRSEHQRHHSKTRRRVNGRFAT